MANAWDALLAAHSSGWDVLLDDSTSDSEVADQQRVLMPNESVVAEQPCSNPFELAPNLVGALRTASARLACPLKDLFHQILREVGYPETTDFKGLHPEIHDVSNFFLYEPSHTHLSKEALGRMLHVAPSRVAGPLLCSIIFSQTLLAE